MFDCDGLLVETESRWTLAEQAVCDRWGVPFSIELKRRLLGTSLDRAGELLAEWVGEREERAPALAAALIAAYREAVDERGVEPMPGAENLVAALAGRVPIAVASNTREADTRRVLARSGLSPERFDAIVCAGDGIEPKPSPDVYLAACAALGAPPHVAVALEDSPLGVAAATTAGLWVIGVPSTPRVALACDLTVSSLTDLAADALLSGVGPRRRRT